MQSGWEEVSATVQAGSAQFELGRPDGRKRQQGPPQARRVKVFYPRRALSSRCVTGLIFAPAAGRNLRPNPVLRQMWGLPRRCDEIRVLSHWKERGGRTSMKIRDVMTPDIEVLTQRTHSEPRRN